MVKNEHKELVDRLTQERAQLKEMVAAAQPWQYVIATGDTVHYVGIAEKGAATVEFDIRKAYTTSFGNATRIAGKFKAWAGGKMITWRAVSYRDSLEQEIEGLNKVLNLFRVNPVTV